MAEMMGAGAKNPYYCEVCKGYIVTVHVDDGVTPIFLACRVKGEVGTPDNDCPGTMHSLGYPHEPWPEKDGYGVTIPTEPGWEWYKPDAELIDLDAEVRDHVAKGGLMLRQIQAEG